jgi:hypothetical protein
MPGNRIPGAHTAQVSGAKIKQADLLITLAEVSELYHTRDSTGFADVCVDGHRETWPIRSKGFRRWLVRRFYEATQGAPNSEALQSALAIIEAKAHFDGVERPVHLRVAELGENLYLDLADSWWRAVEIGASGWRIICDPPVRFRRSAGMMPLPAPTHGGSLAELRPMVNVRSKNDLVLLAAWLLAALRVAALTRCWICSARRAAPSRPSRLCFAVLSIPIPWHCGHRRAKSGICSSRQTMVM